MLCNASQSAGWIAFTINTPAWICQRPIRYRQSNWHTHCYFVTISAPNEHITLLLSRFLRQSVYRNVHGRLWWVKWWQIQVVQLWQIDHQSWASSWSMEYLPEAYINESERNVHVWCSFVKLCSFPSPKYFDEPTLGLIAGVLSSIHWHKVR